ncbi:hypothetical protein LTR06_011331 [Exophiala xenobiotica]|nr:hypothetical protein LTR06_011331 [Exophiala xenobiotica]
MGSPKYLPLVSIHDETIPLIVHIVLLHYLLPKETYTSSDQEVKISVRDDAQITELSSRFASAPIPPSLHINYVTCFFNTEGWAEPLLAIWTSAALSRLRTMADEARPAIIGPIRVIKALEQDVADSTSAIFEYEKGLAKLKPDNELWIKVVNTKEEWQEVQEKFLPTHARLS